MRPKLFLLLLLSFTVYIFPQDTLIIKANYIPYADTTLVFYPQNYNKENSYPLLFMLHGWAGNYAQWSHEANLQDYANSEQFVIVCPDGFYDSWYINSPIDSTHQYETFFFKNLVPEIFNRFNIDKKNIFITGLSMGGHGAMYLFLKNPSFFRSAGSTSGILNLCPFPSDRWGIPKLLGEYKDHTQSWKDHSDIYLLKNIKGQHRKIIVDCGLKDFSYKVSEAFADSARADDVDITFISSPGNHSHKYWRKSIPRHFEFFKKIVEESKNK